MESMTAPVECTETGSLIISREHRDLLERIGFLDFDSIWNFEKGRPIKDIGSRSVTSIPVERRGRKTCVYLKKHKGGEPGIWKRFQEAAGKRKPSPGRREFEHICLFRKNGLATVIPIAAGERESPKNGAQSFILTEDFSPYVQLETLLREDPTFFVGEEGTPKKNALLEEIAGLARKMHEAGFNHRDFNATHIIVYYGNNPQRPELALFDLQRVDVGGIRFRWPIKSIARLNYSLPSNLFSSEDRLRLWMAYKGKERMNFWDRVQWIWIQRKTKQIARHTAKIVRRRSRAAENRLGGA